MTARKPQKDESFKEHILDQLEGVADLSARSMFGGWGFYSAKVFFGLIADGALYFFVDDATRQEYEAAGSGPFTYRRDGKSVSMAYYAVPDGIQEDRDRLVAWARAAVEARKRKSLKKAQR